MLSHGFPIQSKSVARSRASPTIDITEDFESKEKNIGLAFISFSFKEYKGNITTSRVISPEPEEQKDLILFRNKPILTKITKEGSTSYKYTGPVDGNIQDFLEDLYKREGPIKQRGIFEKLRLLNQKIDKRVEEVFPCKTCSDGPIAFNKDAVGLFAIMLIGAIVYSVKLGESVTTQVGFDSIDFVRSYGPLCVYIFTFYGLIYLSLPMGIAFAVFLLQVTIPLFLVLFDANLIFPRDNVPSIDITTLIVRLLVMTLAIFWGIIYIPFKLLRHLVGRFAAHLFVAVLFIGIVICAFGIPFLDLISRKSDLDSSFVSDNSAAVIVFSGFLISFSWIMIHFKYFWVPTPVLEKTLMQLAYKAGKKLLISKTNDEIRGNLIAIPTMKQRIMRNVYWISSMAIGSTYIGLEMYLVERMLSAVEQNSEDGWVISLFFFILIPVFLLLGIPVALMDFHPKNKTLFLPLIVMLPMFALIPISQSVEEITEASNFRFFIIMGPPIIVFFWMALAFLGMKRRRIFYLVFMFITLFFFIPFVFLGLSKSTFFSSATTGFVTVFYVLIGIFAAVTTVWLLRKFYQSLSSFIKRRINLARKKKLNEKELEEIKENFRKQKLEERRKERELAGLKLDKGNEDDDIDEEELEMEELDENDIEVDADGNFTIKKDKLKGKNKEGANKEEGGAKPTDDQNKDEDENVTKARKKLNVIKEVEARRRLQLIKLMYLNFKSFGLWINSASFIISYTFVAYTYYNLSSSASSTELGMLLGVTIVIPIIFVANNLIMRLKTAKLTEDERRIYYQKKDGEKQFYESKLEQDEMRLKKATVVETIVLMVGVLLIPLCQIPFFFIFSNRQAKVTNVFVMLTSIFFSIYLAGTIEAKKRSGPYHKFFIPSFIGICWLLVLLPFVVVVPLLAAILENDSDEYEVFIKASFTGSGFLLMFGVTFFAILINVLFQKLEKEKLIKFIIRALQKVLKENSVKADDVVVRKLIEEYLKKDNEEEIESLRLDLIHDKNPVVPIYPPKFKKTPQFGAGLLLLDMYIKIMRSQENDAKRSDKPKLSLWARLAKCCSEEPDEDFNLDDNVKEIEGDPDDSYFKVDHYMPDETKRNIWNYVLGNINPENDESSENIIEPKDDRYKLIGQTPAEVDFQLKDFMTPMLEKIHDRPLDNEEKRKLNTNEHALVMQDNITQMEIWYQHIYDYFSAKIEHHNKKNESPGMIYQNFMQFIRIADLNQNQEIPKKSLDIAYSLRASKRAEKGYCLAYSDFIQLLVEIACKTIPDYETDNKLLKRFTKMIYPPIMSRVPEIARNYSDAMISFAKSRTPYVPHLDLFDKSKIELNNQRQALPPNRQHNIQQIADESNMRFLVPSSPLARSLGQRKSPKSKFLATNESILSTSQSPYSLINKGPENKTVNKRDQKKKSLGKRILSPCFSCWRWIFLKVGACMHATFVKGPKFAGDWVYKKTKRVGKSLGFAVDENSDDEDDYVVIRKMAQEAPAWPILVDKMLSVIPKAEILYFQKQDGKGITLQFNLTNLIAVVGKVIIIFEIYGFISYAFKSEIPWFEDETPSDAILLVNGEASFLNSFDFLFWFAVGLVGVYLLFSVPAIHYLRKGRLGQDETGKKASFPHPQFFISLIVTIVGGSLFTQIMRFLLQAFACDYTTDPWTLMKDDSIECLGDEHVLYMGVGAVSLLIYYPISTFMFPNFQFQNKVLDLKYDPAFVVIQIQARLLITGFIAFFEVNARGDLEPLLVRLIGIISVLLLLAIASFILKPCLIKKANFWDIASYSLAAWANICALVVVIMDDNLVGIIMLVPGALIIIGTLIFVLRRYGDASTKKKKNNMIGYVSYDLNKRRALVSQDVVMHKGEEHDEENGEVRKRNVKDK